MKKLSLAFTLLFFLTKLSAQSNLQNQYKKWHFGYNTGINFNANTPALISSSSLTTLDYSASISDENGQTLFYTNGSTIWNSNNVMMQNGSGLKGDISGGQTAIILKKPKVGDEVSNLYYVFNVTYYATDGLYYSIVDMDLDNGLGTVTQKNVVLSSVSTEKLTAVYNSENGNYWIITHNWNSNEFVCYKFDATGIISSPVISNIGLSLTHGNFGSTHDAIGQISVSPNGQKIACAYNYTGSYEFYDFDIYTGVVSNAQTVVGFPGAWGIEFSSDSKKIYTTQWTHSEVTQFDISNFNALAIQAAATVVADVNCSDPLYKAGYLELAPDGKIYIAKFNENYLATISNPNLDAANCGFNDTGFDLGNGISKAGLDNTPVFAYNSINLPETKSLTFSVFPNPTSSFININIEAFDNVSKIIVCDVLGNTVIETSHNIKANNQLSTSMLSNGTYFCSVVFNNNTTHTQKLMVIH